MFKKLNCGLTGNFYIITKNFQSFPNSIKYTDFTIQNSLKL